MNVHGDLAGIDLREELAAEPRAQEERAQEQGAYHGQHGEAVPQGDRQQPLVEARQPFEEQLDPVVDPSSLEFVEVLEWAPR